MAYLGDGGVGGGSGLPWRGLCGGGGGEGRWPTLERAVLEGGWPTLERAVLGKRSK